MQRLMEKFRTRFAKPWQLLLALALLTAAAAAPAQAPAPAPAPIPIPSPGAVSSTSQGVPPADQNLQRKPDNPSPAAPASASTSQDQGPSPAAVPPAIPPPTAPPATPAPSATLAAPIGPTPGQGGTIHGSIKAAAVPLPGVSVVATNTLTGKKYTTSTDVTGVFAMSIPRNGRYVIRTELAAFASETKEVLINALSQNGGLPDQAADFTMQLASRAEQAAPAGTALAGLNASAIAQGMQSLSVAGGNADSADASAGAGNAGAQLPTLGGLASGDNAPTDSVAVSGQMGQTNGLANFNEDEIRQRIEDAVAQARQQGGATGDIANAVVGMLGGIMGGGGGFGGPGGGRPGRGGGNFRGFNPGQPHGNIFYQGSNGALNAQAFSLTGAPQTKPAYSNNRFGVSFVGSPFIPGLVKPSTKQFVFFNLTGGRNINPLNLYGTVPTLAEQGGDFSGFTQNINGIQAPVTLYDPTTGKPFPGNIIPANRISSQALALLKFYPAPNISATGTQGYNYETITTAGQNSTQASLRYVRNFGQAGGFGFGDRRQQSANAPKVLRQNINFNGSYSHNASDNRNIFLPLGGNSSSEGYGISAGYTVGYGRLNNNASINWNRSHSTARNGFTNGAFDPALTAGIPIGSPAIQSDPFFFGVPSLSFSGFTGLGNTLPSDSISQTISLSDFVGYNHKHHNMRFGVDVRRVHLDAIGGQNVFGSFQFTGYATQNPAAGNSTRQSPTGSGFADFLLGLPQQSAVQASLQKTYLRGNVIDWYAQDDWRAAANLTLNYGLRYEYFSPYVEKNNHLVNLDHNADFTQVATVLPNGVGPFSGQFPRSLVRPDRTMYSPRFGFAYRPKPKIFKDTVIRGGYGINYNTGQYAFARQFASQQPFSVTQTNIAGESGCGVLSLANAFNCSNAVIQDSFAVNPDYRLGHVQVWNLDIQRTLPKGIVANLGFNASKGGGLDILRAPNRTLSGLLDPNAQTFNYEDSIGYSRFEALSFNLRKRMQKGIALQATYQYGHSIDNASSIGGAGGNTVAQNDQDLNAEEGNSAFDVRQRLNGNFVFELPFGPNRAFLAKGGFLSKALDGFSLSGDYNFTSGTYYTPRYILTSAQVRTGVSGSLRPDRNFSVPIAGAGAQQQWFNPAAFTAPANGFGTASRGSIEGPGVVSINSSLARTVSLGESRSFEARITANNVFNTVQYSGIDTTLNSPTFGQVISTAAMRSFTYQARYRF